MFSAASAAVIGVEHAKRGDECQDAVAHFTSEDLGGIVLCDGAGSCPHSAVGSRDLCLWFPEWAKSHPEYVWNLPESSLAPLLARQMTERLELLSFDSGVDPSDLASTFLAVIARKKDSSIEYRIFHLGDGVAAAIQPDGTTTISLPANGEHANETFFSTSPTLSSSLRVTSATLPAGSSFVIMSDGASSSLFFKSQRALAPAVSSMISWLKRLPSATVSEALEKNLREVIAPRTGDDCSIGVLCDTP